MRELIKYFQIFFFNLLLAFLFFLKIENGVEKKMTQLQCSHSRRNQGPHNIFHVSSSHCSKYMMNLHLTNQANFIFSVSVSVFLSILRFFMFQKLNNRQQLFWFFTFWIICVLRVSCFGVSKLEITRASFLLFSTYV